MCTIHEPFATLRRVLRMAAAALVFVPGIAAGQGPAVIGQVASLNGNASAQRPGQAPRPLACGAPVFAGEQIVTATGSRIGLLLGDVLTQLGEESVLRIDRTAAGAPSATLEQGEVRVIDPREEGAPGRLAVLDTEARILGNDAEAYIFDEKAGRYAMFCEWDGPLPVTRGADSTLVEPLRCVISKPRESLYQADAHEARIHAPGNEACASDPVLLGALDQRFSPLDVAAGPLNRFAPGLPAGPGRPPASPCDVPGSGCAALGGPVGPGPGPGVLPGVVEPPPIGGPFPGVAEPPPIGGPFPGGGP